MFVTRLLKVYPPYYKYPDIIPIVSAKGHSVWLIVGIVVGLVVIVTAVLGGVYFYFKSGLTT